MEPKRTLVLLANTTQKQVWFGEAAMKGSAVRASRLIVEHLNGNVESGLVVAGKHDDDLIHDILCRNWCDEYDLTRCHPLPSDRVLAHLEALKAKGAHFRSGK